MNIKISKRRLKVAFIVASILAVFALVGSGAAAPLQQDCTVTADGTVSCVETCDGPCPTGDGGGNSGGGDSGGNDDGNDDDDSNDDGGGEHGPASDDFTIDGEAWCTPSGSPSGQEGTGGFSLPGSETSTCRWTCGGATILWGYNEASEDWEGIGGGVDPNIPGGFNEPTTPGGLPTCGDWDTTGISFSGRSRVEYICWNELSFSGGGGGSSSGGSSGVSLGGHRFTCGGNYSVTAAASVPCPSVVRNPYPRGLVNTPMQFSLSAGGTSAASQSRQWCEPGVRNYTISVGWDQIPIPPIWDFDERAWSDQSNFEKGWTVFHTYDTSSYAKRENGPSLEGNLDLPAYQVGVTSYWQPWVADSWEQWHELDFDCRNVRDSAGVIIGQEGSECAQRAACSGAAIGDEGCGEWRNHGSGKIMIDLRWFGFPQFYVTRTSARDVTQPPPNIPAVNDELRQCNIPVPVIESQSILVAP